jgi:hypothetical protein
MSENNAKQQNIDRLKELVDAVPDIISGGRFSERHKKWIEEVKAVLASLDSNSDEYKEFANLDFTFHPSSLYMDNSESLLRNLDKTEFELQMKDAQKILDRVLQS